MHQRFEHYHKLPRTVRKPIYELREPALVGEEGEYYLVICFPNGLRWSIQTFFRFPKLNQDTSSFEEWPELLNRLQTCSALTGGSGAEAEAEMVQAAPAGSVDPETVHGIIKTLPLPSRNYLLDFGHGVGPHENSVHPGDGHRNWRFSFSMKSRSSIVPALRVTVRSVGERDRKIGDGQQAASRPDPVGPSQLPFPTPHPTPYNTTT
jgi:hypothetical protein